MLTIRIGDIAAGICPCPPAMCPAVGVVATGNMMNIDTGMPIARLGDMVMFPCGSFIIMIGTPMDIEAGLPASTIGTSCVGAGTGIVTTGNPTHIQM